MRLGQHWCAFGDNSIGWEIQFRLVHTDDDGGLQQGQVSCQLLEVLICGEEGQREGGQPVDLPDHVFPVLRRPPPVEIDRSAVEGYLQGWWLVSFEYLHDLLHFAYAPFHLKHALELDELPKVTENHEDVLDGLDPVSQSEQTVEHVYVVQWARRILEGCD